MKKNSAFEKFLPKKKNSVVKEEARQQKKKWKKERSEGIEKRKAEVRAKFALDKEARGTNKNQAAISKPVVIKADNSGIMPLNKFIAHCGVTARRDAAKMVKEGKVKVNGEVVIEPGFKVSAKDDVWVNGKKAFLAKNLVYILINKPKDYITTADDPEGRRTILDLIRGATPERVFPVGRLDRNTTGVLLMTNDGELTQKLTHPSFEVKKIYEVTLDKPVSKSDFDKVLTGMELEDGFIRADAMAFTDKNDKTIVGIEIHSGRNRIVRRIFEALGYDVRNLDRVMFANLTKKNVERGKWRFLNEKEVRLLKYMNSSFVRKNKDEKKEWAQMELDEDDITPLAEESNPKRTYKKKDEEAAPAAKPPRKTYAHKEGTIPDETEETPLEKKERLPSEKRVRKPYVRKEGGPFDKTDRKSYAKRDVGTYDRGDKKPYTKREGGSFDRGDKKPYAKREGGSFDRGDKKPYAKREGGSFDREEKKTYPRKEGGYFDNKEKKSYLKREGGPSDRSGSRPYVKREPKGPSKTIVKKRTDRS
jgi:23S rRNA pseudouridine2605 synthase